MSIGAVEAKRRYPERGSRDVLVAGGGIAGVAAALGAARNGARVALLEKSVSLGGLATLGNVVTYLPLCDGRGHQVTGGIAEELLRLSVKASGPGTIGRAESRAAIPACWLTESSQDERTERRYQVDFVAAPVMLALESLLLNEGIEIVYDTVCADVVRKKRRIVGVVTVDKGGLCSWGCRSVVDATGDADLCIYSGEEIVSRSGNVRCGWYYESVDSRLGMARMTEPYDEDPAVVPPGSEGHACTDGRSVSAQIVASRKLVRERIERTRNTPGSREVVPIAIPQMATYRMSRRLRGRAEPSAEAALAPHPDTICRIGHWAKPGPSYSIPYGSLIGETPNLFVAGRCISIDDDLWNATRAIPACAATGEAAGVAAALIAESGGTAQELDVGDLRQRLAEAGGLLDPPT